MAQLKIIQIAASADELFALSSDNEVYKYVPESLEKPRYSFWTRLTSYTPAPKMKTSNDKVGET